MKVIWDGITYLKCAPTLVSKIKPVRSDTPLVSDLVKESYNNILGSILSIFGIGIYMVRVKWEPI